jgi:hypothetical protein
MESDAPLISASGRALRAPKPKPLSTVYASTWSVSGASADDTLTDDGGSAASVASKTSLDKIRAPQVSLAVQRRMLKHLSAGQLAEIRAAAATRWLRGNELYSLLHGFPAYPDLVAGLLSEVPQHPAPGSWFLFKPGVRVSRTCF